MPQFRAKARAVELLGKGQISDLPTAITELWKNGYDAYADNLEAFLYMPGYEQLDKPLFVISDDGKGMSRDDILTRWIVLGTDSKSRDTPDKQGPDTLEKPARIKMGEKGIGRLSVAYLGSPMLMLTKQRGGTLQAVFFDWRILENYNLFLEEVNVPLRSLGPDESFDAVFLALKQDFLANFKPPVAGEKDVWSEQENLKQEIITACENAELPTFFDDEILQSSATEQGTKFIIFEPDTQLLALKASVIDRPQQSDFDKGTLDYLRSSLTALFNALKTETPVCTTRVWLINEFGRYDFINKREFFEIKDFDLTDHVIDGRFDENGCFTGTIRIFEKLVSHEFRPHRRIDKLSSYGPFAIKVGYEEGNVETTRLSKEDRRNFEIKLDLFGGLYLYRDDFRILPYGRRDQDFLEFEEKRSRGAGYYYFSHRRMFGYIDLSRRRNPRLRDKAGREGFINNAAYRDFKQDLQQFFNDLAKRYFGTDATSDIKRDQKKALLELVQTEKAEKEKEKVERKAFNERLRTLPDELSRLEREIITLSSQLTDKLQRRDVLYEEVEGLLRQMETYKMHVRSLEVTYPVRFKPTEGQRKRIYEFEKRLESVRTTTVADSDSISREAVSRLHERELLQEFINRSSQYATALADLFAEADTRLDTVLRSLKKTLAEERFRVVEGFRTQVQTLAPTVGVPQLVADALRLIESLFASSQESIHRRLNPFINHLSSLTLDVNEDNLVGYYKLKYEEIENEWQKTRELAQLGIAVEIIDHQFNVLYSQLATTIKVIETDLCDERQARRHYQQLTNAFEHLEGNYKLLQPLYRTTGRVRRPIMGIEFYEYADMFFGEQLREQDISLEITAAAKTLEFFSYDSVLKPAILNIVNNAIYWLRPVETRRILFDADHNRFIIQNSGVPIDDYLLDDIFKLFYSKRPNGRGIGLYLAHTSLAGIGYSLYATNDPILNKLGGGCFVIEPQNP